MFSKCDLMTLCVDTLWLNEKCTIEIGGWENWGYDKEQVDVGETSSRLNVMSGKLQLKANRCFQSVIWWHYFLTHYELMENAWLKWGVDGIGDMIKNRMVKLQVD